MPTITVTSTESVLDYVAAAEVMERLQSLPEDARQQIGEWSANTVDYKYWYRETFETVVAIYRANSVFYAENKNFADRDEAILDVFADGDQWLLGAALAELARPLIGRGVHRRQLNLLEAPFLYFLTVQPV
jgi:hypothetical protein